jgi:hypothetical protein
MILRGKLRIMNNLEYLNQLKSRYFVLGEERNKKGEAFFVCAMKDNDNYTMITLRDVEKKHHPSTLNIITEYFHGDRAKKIIKIADIIIPEKNNGNGSILMKYLFKYVNANENIRKIIGTISEVDNDHFERIEAFYKKHGFKVEFYVNDKGERISGYLEKELLILS